MKVTWKNYVLGVKPCFNSVILTDFFSKRHAKCEGI